MGRAGRILRHVFLALVAAVTLAAAMVWGFYVHRNRVFPYNLSHRVLDSVLPKPLRRLHGERPVAGRAVAFQEIERLAQLPYLRGYRPSRAPGAVRIHVPALAFEGLNLFVSSHAPQAILMDMDGNVVRTWACDASKAFPAIRFRGRLQHEGAQFFRDALLLPDGDVVAMFQDIGLVRLGAASEVRWAWQASVHHEIFADGGGSIWTLTHEKRPWPDLHPDGPVLDDFVVELSPDGRPIRQVSILESFQRSLYLPLLTRLRHEADVLHTNSVQIFDGSLAKRSRLFRKGNILLTIRDLGFLAILDPDEHRIVWALTGQWHRQHSARLLPTGHLILFDNLGTLRAASRILELDPFTQEVLWRFGGVPGEDFFSETNGFVRRLPNGNTLVGEANGGRVLEVTPDRRVVWEFTNPHRVGKANELVAIIFDLHRVPRDQPFLNAAVGAAVPAPRDGALP
jgi:hypothetical protein